jgi:hypothetical protein
MIPYDKDGASKSHLPVQTTTAGFPLLGVDLTKPGAQKKLQSMHARGIRLIGLVDVVDSKQSQNKHTVATIAGPISIVNTSDQPWLPGDMIQFLPVTLDEQRAFFIPQVRPPFCPLLLGAAVEGKSRCPCPSVLAFDRCLYLLLLPPVQENLDTNPVLEPRRVDWRTHDLLHYESFVDLVLGGGDLGKDPSPTSVLGVAQRHLDNAAEVADDPDLDADLDGEYQVWIVVTRIFGNFCASLAL